MSVQRNTQKGDDCYELNGPQPVCHPNGVPIKDQRGQSLDQSAFKDVIFPPTSLGNFLQGILRFYLLKGCQRAGWLRKGACSDPGLYPNESVASHSWGISILVTFLSRLDRFKKEMPNFDVYKALQMVIVHDVPEIITGDITPVDGVDPDVKHKLEQQAMVELLSPFDVEIKNSIHKAYEAYEKRSTIESKFVKDCDKLDFIIYAFLLERQGFAGFSEFYDNTYKSGFFTKLAYDLASLLIETRNDLAKNNKMFYK